MTTYENIFYTYQGITTNATYGIYGTGQSFTMTETANVGKITTTAIGGVTGEQLIAGIESSYIIIREFVNNNETTTPPTALSGTILATSGYGMIINPINPYNGSETNPVSQFILAPVLLTIGTKYVIEWVIGAGVGVYVDISGGSPPGENIYTGGQAYDISGNNLEFNRDSPMGVWKSIPPPPPSGCDWNPDLSGQTTIWSRYNGDCTDLSGVGANDQPLSSNGYNLSEKRKAVIFQYKNNNINMSSKQLYSRLARGIGRQRGSTFATQSDSYTNANTKNLQNVNVNTGPLLCPNSRVISAYTSQNNTPGPKMLITNYPNAPLYNYRVRRTYSAGNTKWPQYGPNTGQPRDPKLAGNSGSKPGYQSGNQ
jgi:hypothetical protein